MFSYLIYKFYRDRNSSQIYKGQCCLLYMGESLRNMGSSYEHNNRFEESSIKAPVCRICYDIEKENNLLLYPCKCTGSVKYLHEECLKTWLVSTSEDLNDRACELCHTKFKMSYKIKTCLNCSEIWDENISSCLFIPILLLILGLIVMIVYFLIVKYQNKDSQYSDKIYALALASGCLIAAMIVVFILVFIFKNYCLKSKLIDWKILNQEPEIEMNEKSEENEVLQTQGIDNNIMIIPKVTKINGKKIKSPKVAPISLVPVVEAGLLIGYKSEKKEKFVQSYNEVCPKPGSKQFSQYNERHNLTL